MCDCAYRVHPGIECGAEGCNCHPADQPPGPAIVIPPDADLTEAEAIGLAVAGAVQSIVEERLGWQFLARDAHDALRLLLDNYPATSFAGPETAREKAAAVLDELAQALGIKPETKP